MKILIWNIRGVGNDISRNLLKSHCSQHRPDWLILLEPKISSINISCNFLRSLNFVFFAENQRVNKLPNIWLFCSINTAASATVIGHRSKQLLCGLAMTYWTAHLDLFMRLRITLIGGLFGVSFLVFIAPIFVWWVILMQSLGRMKESARELQIVPLVQNSKTSLNRKSS
ncbi:hypothetical protein ACS0TY_025640 [Phlomoides rotata]